MKILVLVLFVSSVAIASSNAKKRILPVTKEQEIVKKEKIQNEKLKAIVKEEEDCDEKAKKPIEIKPESISLTGDAGCSLDDAH
ncbi:MAG: hypothetical protein ACLGHN_13705 [Bacteriovoracia bacterium]